jgi:hypothetical protein
MDQLLLSLESSEWVDPWSQLILPATSPSLLSLCQNGGTAFNTRSSLGFWCRRLHWWDPVSLETFLTVSSASHIQNWIHVWRPMIISTIKAAQDKLLWGVCTLTEYYAPTNLSLPHPNTGPHHPDSQDHHTARPQLREKLCKSPNQLSGSNSSPSLVNLPACPTILLHQNLPPSVLINGDSFSVGGFAPTICDRIATYRSAPLSCLWARRLEL